MPMIINGKWIETMSFFRCCSKEQLAVLAAEIECVQIDNALEREAREERIDDTDTPLEIQAVIQG